MHPLFFRQETDNLTLLHLPPYARELNPAENVWEYLRKNKLAISVFDGYADIVDKYCQAWNFFAKRQGRRYRTEMGRGPASNAFGISLYCECKPAYYSRIAILRRRVRGSDMYWSNVLLPMMMTMSAFMPGSIAKDGFRDL